MFPVRLGVILVVIAVLIAGCAESVGPPVTEDGRWHTPTPRPPTATPDPAKPQPTATPRPSPTVVPPTRKPPSAEDLEAAEQMFGYTVSQMPGVLGADLKQEGSTVYIFVEVARGFDPYQALNTGDNIVRQVLLLLGDGKHGQFIGETAYDYLIGFYYPGDADAILTGEKKSRYRGVLWR